MHLTKYLTALIFLTCDITILAQSNTFPSSGNVGLGNLTPTQKLQFGTNSFLGMATAYPNIPLSWQRGDTGIILSGASNADGSGWSYGSRMVVVDAGDGLYTGFDTNYAGTWLNDVLTISGRSSGMGNIGIGINTPTQKLHFSPNSFVAIPPEFPYVPTSWQRGQSGLILAGASAPTGFGWSYGSRVVVVDANDGLYTSIDVDNQAIWTNNALVISGRAGTVGNVGIGTINPTQKLSVNGTVRAKEVIVDTNWADFVFDQDYKLPTLQEVEHHIQQEKHLPGIPSAAEVHEHGISLGEMQARLLEKIEELTLHQIEQEKALKAMQAENLELRRRIAAGGL